MSSLEKCLFKFFAHFLIVFFVFLEWSQLSSLYILEIKPLFEISLANMFSHMVGSLFILLMFSLAVHMLFSLILGIVVLPILFFFLKIAEAIQGHFWLHVNF